MSDIFVMCQPAMKDRGSNLAEAVVKRAGSGVGTFDLCPRVVDTSNNQWLWASLQRSESIAGPDWDWVIPDLGRNIDLADAQALLVSAVVIRPEAFEEGAALPDIDGRFVIGVDVTPQALLAAYGMQLLSE